MVVLAETKNITRTNRQTSSARTPVVRPAPARQRITGSLRKQVVARYTNEAISAKALGEELGLAKSSVLRILKDAGVDIRPHGQRIT